MYSKTTLILCLLLVGCSYDQSVKQDEEINYIEVEFPSLVREFQQDPENATKKWNQKPVTIAGYMQPTTNSIPQPTFSLVPFLSMKFNGYDKFEVVRVNLKENTSVPYEKSKLTVSGLISVGTTKDFESLSLNEAFVHEENSANKSK